MSSDNRYSYVREMRRTRARRIAIAKLAHFRNTTHTATAVDPSPASQTAVQRHDAASLESQKPLRKPLVCLGKHSTARRRAIRVDRFLSTRVYRGLWVATFALTSALAGTSSAQAAGLGIAADLPKDTLTPVIDQLRLWLIIVLGAVATLFFVVGGLRYITSNGDPGEIERAKSALKSSAIGYALALLAPIFIGIVKSLIPEQK